MIITFFNFIFVISLLGTLFLSFQVSIVWSIISNDDNEERIINIPNDTSLKEETNNTFEIEKDFLSEAEKKLLQYRKQIDSTYQILTLPL